MECSEPGRNDNDFKSYAIYENAFKYSLNSLTVVIYHVPGTLLETADAATDDKLTLELFCESMGSSPPGYWWVMAAGAASSSGALRGQNPARRPAPAAGSAALPS